MDKNGGDERKNTVRNEEIPDAALVLYPGKGHYAFAEDYAGCTNRQGDVVQKEDCRHGLCFDGETEKRQAGISHVSRCSVLHPGGYDVFPDICWRYDRWHPFRTGAMVAVAFS